MALEEGVESQNPFFDLDLSSFLFLFLGGLSAVIWTDFIQTILMIIGAILLAILGRYT